MFRYLMPLFDLDGDSSAPSSPSWYEVLSNAVEADTDDGQSDEDPDDVEVEADEDDEGEHEEQDDEGEDDQPQVEDDPDIDLGEGKQPVKMSELKSGYLRQSDYTKKTQELASQRKEVEAQAESLKPVQQWLDHMNQNPWFWQQIQGAIEEFNQTEVLDFQTALQDAQYGKYINHLLAENNRLKGDLDRVNGEYEGVKLSGAMTNLRNELQAEYGDLVTDEYMQQLQERAKTGLTTDTLKEIADGHLAKQLMQSKQTSKKKTEAAAAQKIAETRKKAPAAPKATSGAPGKKSNDYSNMNWREALEASWNNK